MSILRWLKKAEVTGLPDPNKQQNAEMKSVVAAANDAVRPVDINIRSVHPCQNRTNWKIREIKMQRIFYIRKSRN